MSFGRLASHKAVAAGTHFVYQVPIGKVFKGNISVVNNSGANSAIYLYISPTPTPANDYVIQKDILSVNNNGYERRALVAKAGECICYKTEQPDVNVVVYGILDDTLSEDFSTTVLITSNTDTTAYSNPSAKPSSVNVSVSLTEGDNFDTAVVELYVTTSDVAGGFLLQKETLRAMGTTGFERGGLALSSTDKLIVRTTELSGGISVRVSGYTE